MTRNLLLYSFIAPKGEGVFSKVYKYKGEKDVPTIFIYIEEEVSSNGCLLIRHGANWVFICDTWHMSLEEAKEQAQREFGDNIIGWEEFPEGVEDPLDLMD